MLTHSAVPAGHPVVPEGRDYLCALDGVVIPDGVDVHAYLDPDGKLIGVKAVKYHPTGWDENNQPTQDAETVHECGDTSGVPGG